MASSASRPTVAALHAETGNLVGHGHGQDNLVHALIMNPEVDRFAESGGWVVKVGHQKLSQDRQKRRAQGQIAVAADAERRAADETVMLGTAYKKNKYEILKHFLGDYIPESIFLASTVEQDGISRPAEITLQRRLPEFHLNELTESQKNDPRLITNMVGLFDRLKYMYSVIGEVNGRTSHEVNLDGKLDLGGVSKFAKGTPLDYKFTEADANKTIHMSDTKNILIDPATMGIYCIDFDQGDWTEGMDEAKTLLFNIDAHRHESAATAARVALRGFVPPPPTE